MTQLQADVANTVKMLLLSISEDLVTKEASRSSSRHRVSL